MISLNRSKSSVFRLWRGAAARCLLAAVPLAIAPAAHAGYNLTSYRSDRDRSHQPAGHQQFRHDRRLDNGVTNEGFTLTLPDAASRR